MTLSRHTMGAYVLVGFLVTDAGCSRPEAVENEPQAVGSVSRPVAVKTVAVVQEDVRRTSVQPATVHPFYVAAIQAKVHGYVKKRSVATSVTWSNRETLWRSSMFRKLTNNA